LILPAYAAHAADVAAFPELRGMNLSELLAVKVTSVSKREQSQLRAPTAIYVLTGEDLRRSGVSSIPEALRGVPGLHVAKLDANIWAISARGFNRPSQFSNKLLVMMDGRTLYTPLFAGVYWDVQDTPLNDVERIEVIRGPGATIWGANAVNGVINIITKKAEETQGGHLSLRTGTEDEGIATLRYGGHAGDHLHYRVYGKVVHREGGYLGPGDEGRDDTEIDRAGFRMDWAPSTNERLMLQGELYDGEAGSTTQLFDALTDPGPTTVNFDQDLSGGDLLLRWERSFERGGDLSVQTYYDRTKRKTRTFGEERDTYDLELQHSFSPATRHELTWGLGYRFTERDITYDSFAISFDQHHRDDHLTNLFAQDEIELIADELTLWIGSKVEHNDFTGWEIQPSVRSTWTPRENHIFWGAISRAARTPSEAEEDLRINVTVGGSPALPLLVAHLPQENLDAEILHAFELGYRFLFNDAGLVDLAFFYNDYEDIYTLEVNPIVPESDPPPLHLLASDIVDRKAEGHSSGLELATEWQPLQRWHLTASYSLLRMHIRGKSSSNDPGTQERWDYVPTHQFQARSLLNLPHGLEFDLLFYAVENLPGNDNSAISGYERVDLRLGWRPESLTGLDLSVGVQNLTDKHHAEFWTGGVVPTEAERAYWIQASWDF
jgi:iron complex outermembrane receptor protein